MCPFRFARGFVGLLMLCGIVLSINGQVIVYQDSATPEGVVGNYTMEYGDEVMLTGTARIVTRLRFEYGGTFYADGDETARVRIYANDGPFWKGNVSYGTPHTLLWESPIFPILSGYNTKELAVPSIRVPDHFTWTIQFYGLSMSTVATTPDPTIHSDYAGLSFYGLAEIGASFNDFWQFLTEGWTPVRVGTVVKNNFSASVTAIDEAVVPTLQITKTATGVMVSWPRAAFGYNLQSQSQPGDEWVDFPGISLVSGDQYQANVNPGNAVNLFRLKKLETAAELSITTNLDGTVRVSWAANVLRKVLQSSATADLWTDENTPASTSGTEFVVTLPVTAQGRVFRLRDETMAASIKVIREGTILRLRWPAEASGYRVQSKEEGGTQFWTLLNYPISQNDGYFETVVPTGNHSAIFRLFR